jgi:hypothetical protein
MGKGLTERSGCIREFPFQQLPMNEVKVGLLNGTSQHLEGYLMQRPQSPETKVERTPASPRSAADDGDSLLAVFLDGRSFSAMASAGSAPS